MCSMSAKFRKEKLLFSHKNVMVILNQVAAQGNECRRGLRSKNAHVGPSCQLKSRSVESCVVLGSDGRLSRLASRVSGTCSGE